MLPCITYLFINIVMNCTDPTICKIIHISICFNRKYVNARKKTGLEGIQKYVAVCSCLLMKHKSTLIKVFRDVITFIQQRCCHLCNGGNLNLTIQIFPHRIQNCEIKSSNYPFFYFFIP